MNSPQYILTDEMEAAVLTAKTALGFSVLNYQYGYVEELNETLKQYEADPAKYDKKFPLVWLAEPFTTEHGIEGIYGISTIDIFIINKTEKTYKAKERMENNYKPILYPIANELLKQFTVNPVFSHISVAKIQYRTTKGYYWGEGQQAILNDTVDCLKLGSLRLRINDNQNCTILTNI